MKPLIKDNLNFKSLRVVKELIPKKSVVNSFLFYSGALEFNLAEDDRFISARTTRYVVYEFWRCVLEDPFLVGSRAQSFFKLLGDDPHFSNEKTFAVLQESWPKYEDPWTRSAYFFLLNRCSERGLISSGKLNIKYFNPLSVINLKSFAIKNFHIHFDGDEDFIDTLDAPKEANYLFFPVGGYGYNLLERGKSKGHETTIIHHKKLYENLQEQNKRWVVLYKKHAGVFDLYNGYNIIMVDKYGRKTNRKDKCEDIVIANF
jgi:hypothetical protein